MPGTGTNPKRFGSGIQEIEYIRFSPCISVNSPPAAHNTASGAHVSHFLQPFEAKTQASAFPNITCNTCFTKNDSFLRYKQQLFKSNLILLKTTKLIPGKPKFENVYIQPVLIYSGIRFIRHFGIFARHSWPGQYFQPSPCILLRFFRHTGIIVSL